MTHTDAMIMYYETRLIIIECSFLSTAHGYSFFVGSMSSLMQIVSYRSSISWSYLKYVFKSFCHVDTKIGELGDGKAYKMWFCNFPLPVFHFIMTIYRNCVCPDL